MLEGLVRVDVQEFIQSIQEWNDDENTGKIIRSLIESVDELKNKSKSKAIRKFITCYCPFVMDNIEIMSGISEEWSLKDVIKILKKQDLRGKELASKLMQYVNAEFINMSSEASLAIVEKMKSKLSLEDLSEVIIMIMLQSSGKFGWQFVERISKSWTDEKLKELVQLILDNEFYDDIGGGSDCGLFELFPHLERCIKIREVDREEEEDSIGSLADFIEDDCNSNQDDYEEEESDEEDIIEITSENDSENEKNRFDRKSRKRESKNANGSKRRKVIVVSSDSDCYVCFANKRIGFLF